MKNLIDKIFGTFKTESDVNLSLDKGTKELLTLLAFALVVSMFITSFKK